MHATGITAAGPRQFDGMSATPDADRSELLLVHGAWHGAWAFDELGSRLDEAGLRWRAVNLPSAGSTADLAADADVVRQALAERAVPTVLVGHSYGGLVISEAAAGVDHVTALVYLCAFMLDAGESLLSAQQHQVPDWIAVDEQAGTSTVRSPFEVFYHDCPGELAGAAAARLVPQSLAAFAAPQTAAAWNERPSTYVICEQDHAIPPAAQEAMSARADTVERLDRSHSPFLSAPEELIPVMRRAAERVPTAA
jgi:pimeloyl-ACP methyl ester carboxylesterase